MYLYKYCYFLHNFNVAIFILMNAMMAYWFCHSQQVFILSFRTTISHA